MIESDPVIEDLIETSVFEFVSAGSSDLNQEAYHSEGDYDVNIKEEQLSLSQYYSHFADGSQDLTPGCISFNTPKEPVVGIPSDKGIVSSQMFSDQEMGIYNVRKPKIWKCAYNCGKIFTQEKYMRNHILVMHENTSSVQCKICFRYLSTKARLKNHMLRHAGVDHLVCLICTNKRTNDRSCMRHHLSEKHGITSKHSLFHESYYEMSLKEISLMEKSKGTGLKSEKKTDCVKQPGICKKSANDIEELKMKIMEKSKKVKKLLNHMKKTNNNSKVEEKITETDEVKNDSVAQAEDEFNAYSEPQKIVTAENGMKLMKLANGQFRKITSI